MHTLRRAQLPVSMPAVVLIFPPPSPPLYTFRVFEKEANMRENEVIPLSQFLHEKDASSMANPYGFHQLPPAAACNPPAEPLAPAISLFSLLGIISAQE